MFGGVALGLAIADVIWVPVSLVLPALTPGLIFLSTAAVGLGIIALVLRTKRYATSLVLPILAIVLASVVAILGSVAWVGDGVAHKELTTPTLVFPNNPELTKLFATTQLMERRIRGDGSAYHWPASIAPDSSGRVVLDGKVIATLQSGQSMTYTVTKGGEDFVLIVRGSVPGENFYYDLDTHIIRTFCYSTDTTCEST